MSTVSQATRERVASQARFRCGYCLTQEQVSGVPLTVEHLLPRAKGGNDADIRAHVQAMRGVTGITDLYHLVRAVIAKRDVKTPLPQIWKWFEKLADAKSYETEKE